MKDISGLNISMQTCVREAQLKLCFHVNSKALSQQEVTEELIDTQNANLLNCADI